ncbi:MAG: DedA family protein [Candidatus Zixiibacteriota bacterium]|nr:MAG: DedA family protein [candidate division Zixibacteria bacterium]
MLKIFNAPFRWTRQLYDWVLKWGKSDYALPALFILAFAEASFFPIPPDALLIALCMGAYKKWFKFATICSVGSVLGGVAGYLIGMLAFDTIGEVMLDFSATLAGTSSEELLSQAQYWFNEKEVWGMLVGPWAVGIAGFTPIPYKVFTISAGFFNMSFIPFLAASLISRTLRFFIVAGLIGLLYKKFGDKIKDFIDKYFNWLAIGFVILLILGFLSIKLLKG